MLLVERAKTKRVLFAKASIEFAVALRSELWILKLMLLASS